VRSARRPTSERFDPQAQAVSGLDRGHLASSGAEPATAMRELADWIAAAAKGGRPVFVAFNATFDWTRESRQTSSESSAISS